MAILSTPIDYLASTPAATKSFAAATVACSGLYAWLSWNGSDSMPYLVLIPGSSIFYPWTFISSAFVETSILELVFSLIFIPPSLRYLERLWGSIETIKFMAISIGISNLISFAFNWIEFLATRNADIFLYGMRYHGQMALQIAVLVALTQLIPEHQVQLFGVFKTRVKTLPMAYLTLSTILVFLGFQCPWIVIQFGWYVSWVYLRFYKKTSGDSSGTYDSYGDRSETFSLVSWFPPFLHYPISLLGNTVFSLASRFHLIPASIDIESGGYNQVPGSARAEAERRRAMALKALDQRVANSSTPGPSNTSSSQAQAPRPPPSATKADSPPMSGRERKKSVSEADVSDTAAR